MGKLQISKRSTREILDAKDHFAAGILPIINFNGQQQFVMGFDWEGNCLDTFGGSRDKDETVLETLMREIREESHDVIAPPLLIQTMLPNATVLEFQNDPRKYKNQRYYYLFIVDLGERDFEQMQDAYRASIDNIVYTMADMLKLDTSVDSETLLHQIHNIGKSDQFEGYDQWMMHVEHTDIGLVSLESMKRATVSLEGITLWDSYGAQLCLRYVLKETVLWIQQNM